MAVANAAIPSSIFISLWFLRRNSKAKVSKIFFSSSPCCNSSSERPPPPVRSNYSGIQLAETVKAGSEKSRVDSWISLQIPGISRARVQSSIRSGLVTVNGRIIDKVSHIVKGGDTVSCTVCELEPLRAEAEEIPLNIVYEDAHVLVLNKPAHMVSQSLIQPSEEIRVQDLEECQLLRVQKFCSKFFELSSTIVDRSSTNSESLLRVELYDLRAQVDDLSLLSSSQLDELLSPPDDLGVLVDEVCSELDDLRSLIDEFFPPPGWIDAQKKAKMADAKTMNILAQTMSDDIFQKVVECTFAKAIWDSLNQIVAGSSDERKDRRSLLISQYENFKKEESETVADMYNRLSVIINKLRTLDKDISLTEINYKILISSEYEEEAKTREVCLMTINASCSKADAEEQAEKPEEESESEEDQLGPKVIFGDSNCGQTKGYEDVKVGAITFRKIAYVSDLKHNLISISQLCDEGFQVPHLCERLNDLNLTQEVPSHPSPQVEEESEEDSLEVAELPPTANIISQEQLIPQAVAQPTPPTDLVTLRDHPISQVIGDISVGVQTMHQFNNDVMHAFFISQLVPHSIKDAEQDPHWIIAMQEELNQFERKTMATPTLSLSNMKFDTGFNIDFDSSHTVQIFIDILKLCEEQNLKKFMTTRIKISANEIREWVFTSTAPDAHTMIDIINGNQVTLTPEVLSEIFDLASGEDEMELDNDEYENMLSKMGHSEGKLNKLLKKNLSVQYKFLVDIVGKVLLGKHIAHDYITIHQTPVSGDECSG
ncbi:hypothetical protein KSP40_PGU015611 [Platanthera guangdongensis]|uniref:RNA-binding S4 domain-containing protein n=1 Tax=Platanthera guangdongensis TaxID=2320717 RepID=A0ABR2MTT9_9ASPA